MRLVVSGKGGVGKITLADTLSKLLRSSCPGSRCWFQPQPSR